MSTAPSTYEQRSRERKAYSLMHCIAATVKATTAEDVSTLADELEKRINDPAFWQQAAERAHVNPPSEKTRPLVVALTRKWAAALAEAPANPFVGQPS